MDFDLFFFFFPQELTIYIEELAHAGLACKVVLARAVPKDSTWALNFIIEMKPCPRPTARDDPLPNNIVFAELQLSTRRSVEHRTHALMVLG